MRCPAIEGIETDPSTAILRTAAALRRMRCPAIEGIETIEWNARPKSAALDEVECVAPLLRGLKPRRSPPTLP